jgi:hypothetical protein
MGSFGGFAGAPFSFGGGPRRAELFAQALNEGRGRLYDTSDWSSGPSVENRAFADAIDAEWAQNERMANQFVPDSVTDMLPRWERIFELVLVPGDTPSSRRQRLGFAFQALGKNPTPQQIADDLAYLLGALFIDVEMVGDADSGAIYPGFNSVGGGNPNPYDPAGTTTDGVSYVDWSSAIAHVAVQVAAQPAWMSTTVYRDTIALMTAYLDGALPAQCTFSSYVAPLGFFLDQQNLNYRALLF